MQHTYICYYEIQVNWTVFWNKVLLDFSYRLTSWSRMEPSWVEAPSGNCGFCWRFELCFSVVLILLSFSFDFLHVRFSSKNTHRLREFAHFEIRRCYIGTYLVFELVFGSSKTTNDQKLYTRGLLWAFKYEGSMRDTILFTFKFSVHLKMCGFWYTY